jgi:hypothetical protein
LTVSQKSAGEMSPDGLSMITPLYDNLVLVLKPSCPWPLGFD